MPATEQTWRNSKRLHLVFGLSSLAMLLATLWMLRADHDREYKKYMRTFRKLEEWQAQASIGDLSSAEYLKTLAAHEARVRAAKSQIPDLSLVDKFLEIAASKSPLGDATHEKANGYALGPVEAARDSLEKADAADEEKVAALRQDLVQAMQKVVARAKFAEDTAQRDLKFKRAEADAKRSEFDIAVGEFLGPAQLAELQEEIDREVKGDKSRPGVDPLNVKFNDANLHRKQLQLALSKLTEDEAAAFKSLQDQEGKLAQLERAHDERMSTVGKRILEFPIIDAFGGPLKPAQIWLPQLTRFNNYKDVARFDRCTTCHQGIEKTAPGSATGPGYPQRLETALTLPVPPAAPVAEKEETPAQLLDRAYGIVLAETGLVEDDDVTVAAVRNRSLAAKALLQVGDVLRVIGGSQVRTRDQVYLYLLETPVWGSSLAITVDRGVPQPYSSHPRLDLFVGSLSPHKSGDLGCTICHEGQGSATAFKWASHTPDNPRQGRAWSSDLGWFNNHHWIFPQLPKRFLESNCLKCHHDLVELEPSERFPDPPAPKLLEGRETLAKYGCFGCHEINGFDGPKKRRGPDLRSEPNYHAAAAQLLIDPNLTDEERALARRVIDRPDDASARHLLAERVLADDPAKPPANGAEAGAPRLASDTYKLGKAIDADEETPGSLRKVGPSLRYIGKKVDLEFLYSWIADPTNFRPSTKMPRFFGLHDHLELENRTDDRPPEDALRYEPIEVLAISKYLLAASETQVAFEYIEPAAEVTEEPSAERGKGLFERRGCLNCHRHRDFPAAQNEHGPDLSGMGAKMGARDAEQGFKWLYSWVRKPNLYHARTAMPDVQLTTVADAEGKVTDPAADVAAYLLGTQIVGPPTAEGEASPAPWAPHAPPPDLADGKSKKALDDLAMLYLKAAVPNRKQAEDYLKNGIPASASGDLKGDELVLVGRGEMSDDKKLQYVGRRTIGRLGCSGCHDIPGFEDAKPIGTALADWGRKEPSKLAFEQIMAYLQEHPPAKPRGVETSDEDYPDPEGEAARQRAEQAERPHLDPREFDDDTGFFVEALTNHQREGFLWQKLREPRSYDYRKTANKDYSDRLRMPKFPLTAKQREAVMTFVLGLVAEPPPAKYVYKANKRRQAILDGQVVLDKYNCAGCHVLKLEEWEIQFDPADPKYAEAQTVADYPFLAPHFTPKEREDARQTDKRGLGSAKLRGRRDLDTPTLVDGKDPETNEYFFMLWEPANVNGHAWWTAEASLAFPEPDVVKQRPMHGGEFARLLYGTALEYMKQTKGLKDFKVENVWGWLPPPLVGEGRKVQTAWLHDFLLDPHEIRPATLLRMPDFRLTPDEATRLVNYFAAVDDVDFPYEYDPRTRTDYLASAESQRAGRLDDALKVLVDKKNFCASCHRIGDYKPTSTQQAHGPNLDRIYRRLRPDYVRRWVANPRRQLPYTAMPQLFSPTKEQAQDLFQGTSQEQLEAVADLLSNYDDYMKRRSFAGLISPDEPAATEPAPPAGEAAGGEAVESDGK